MKYLGEDVKIKEGDFDEGYWSEKFCWFVLLPFLQSQIQVGAKMNWSEVMIMLGDNFLNKYFDDSFDVGGYQIQGILMKDVKQVASNTIVSSVVSSQVNFSKRKDSEGMKKVIECFGGHAIDTSVWDYNQIRVANNDDIVSIDLNKYDY